MGCHICNEGGAAGTQLWPCTCSGSAGLVRVSRHPRPAEQWLCGPAGGTGENQRNLSGDAICFLLLTPLAALSVFLCSSGADYYSRQGRAAAKEEETDRRRCGQDDR